MNHEIKINEQGRLPPTTISVFAFNLEANLKATFWKANERGSVSVIFSHLK